MSYEQDHDISVSKANGSSNSESQEMTAKAQALQTAIENGEADLGTPVERMEYEVLADDDETEEDGEFLEPIEKDSSNTAMIIVILIPVLIFGAFIALNYVLWYRRRKDIKVHSMTNVKVLPAGLDTEIDENADKESVKGKM